MGQVLDVNIISVTYAFLLDESFTKTSFFLFLFIVRRRPPQLVSFLIFFYVIKRNGHVFKQFDVLLEVFDALLEVFDSILWHFIRRHSRHSIARSDEILLNNVCVL